MPAFAALGYRQLMAHFAGEASLAEAAQRAKFETHRFIRQQYTWFRRADFGTRWVDVEERQAALDELQAAVDAFLEGRDVSPMVYSTATSPV
jgi:tRNA dimethylallyltransferase